MKKIFTLLLMLCMTVLAANAQSVIIQENFQDWPAQSVVGPYTITKVLFDGTPNATFTASSLIVEPTQPIGSAGTATGNGSPSIGRVKIAGVTSELQLPQLPSIGVVNIKMSVGTDLNGYKLQVLDGVTWVDIPGTSAIGSKTVTKLFTHNLTYSTPTTIRIIANQSGSVNIWDVEVYSYVSGLTTLSTPVVSAATNITSSGFTANWTSVTNASGYEVKTYIGSELMNTSSITGQSTSSLAITGLYAGLPYTYKVIAKGDLVSYDNSLPSNASASCNTLEPYAAPFINTNFGDGTWGAPIPTPTTNLPVSGSWPTTSVNGFELVKSVLYGQIPTGPKGEIHTNTIRFDKNTYNATLIMPTVNSVSQIEIHAFSGSDTKSFLLKEFNTSTLVWDLVGTYNTMISEDIFIIPLSRSTPTKFKIENNTTSALSIAQVITRTTTPVLLTPPSVGAVSDIVGNGFTAHWTPNDANATGYKILVYASSLPSTTKLRSTFTVSGQATNSYVVAGIDTAAICSYKVVALGDGDVLFSDSYASAASASFAVAGVPTAINNPKFDEGSFKLYPNPASGNINFDYTIANDSKVKMVIYNLNNQVVRSYMNNEPHGAGTYSKSFDVSELKPGIYFVRFTMGKISKTLKLVVKR